MENRRKKNARQEYSFIGQKGIIKLHNGMLLPPEAVNDC